MNERIQELAEQASFDVDQIMAEILCPDYNGTELYKLIDAYTALPKEVRSETVEIIRKKQEKFAELIVNECAEIFGQEGTGKYQVDGNWIAKTIKQHFGVKE